MQIKKIEKIDLDWYEESYLDKISNLNDKLNEVIEYLNQHISTFQTKKEVAVIVNNWYKYDKIEWLSSMRRALNDIETNNGENLVDILEDYYENVKINIYK